MEKIDYRYVVHYKTYPRLDNIPLEDRKLNNPICSILNKRRSRRESSNKILPKDLFHPLISTAAGRTGKNEDDKDFRAYPSAGARYPLELYVLSFNIKGLEPGIYHFSPVNNFLEILWKGDLKNEIINLFEISDHAFLNDMKTLFIITAIEERTTFKYGDPGKIFPLIESRYLGANIVLLFENEGYNPIVIGTQWCQKELERILDLNAEKEKVVSSIAIL